MLGSLAKRYESREILGRGDLGTTHLATDVSTGEWVALKIFVDSVDFQGLDGLRYRNRLETARGAVQPNLIVPAEAGLAGGRAYQISPYFPGESLQALLASASGERPWSASDVLTLLGQLASGLDALHVRGLRHGNLKLSNILVSREGEAFAVACGLHVGGKRPFVIIQNTGLLEAGDAFRGTAYNMGIPLVSLVGYRGYHSMAKADDWTDTAATFLEPTLKAWRIPYSVMKDDADIEQIAGAFERAEQTGLPRAVLLTAETV